MTALLLTLNVKFPKVAETSGVIIDTPLETWTVTPPWSRRRMPVFDGCRGSDVDANEVPRADASVGASYSAQSW